jgi:murein DD-endopeptidase MepM/ murein hydrolase activator NlpD
MKSILQFLFILLSPLYAHTDIDVFTDNPVTLKWMNYGDTYEYLFEIYKIKGNSKVLTYTSPWILENSFDIDIEQECSYLWELYIKERNKTCEDENQCFNIESKSFDFYFSTNKETQKQENDHQEYQADNNIIKKEIEEEKENKSKQVLGSSSSKYVSKKEFEENFEKDKNNKEDQEQKTNFHENFCNITYNITKKTFRLEDCNIEKPIINSSTYYKYNDKFFINSKGNYQDKIQININNVACKSFDLLNPKTWFRCEEILIGKNEYHSSLKHEVYFNKDLPPTNYIFKDQIFEILNITEDLPTKLTFKSYFSIKHKGEWLDQELIFSKEVFFKEVKNLGKDGIYSFPFSKIINVNQWHGCTKYQCPHTGIDFAAIRENIYASDDGIVVAKGYDTYSGECNSGGYYLVIQYDSGHHMAYMHLDKMYVKENQKVKKRDLIALSGNSGSHNCQPLGYHLHFELREERKQSSHIDPVPYLNIDWNLVHTNHSNLYPKRLSGDNPHPSF